MNQPSNTLVRVAQSDKPSACMFIDYENIYYHLKNKAKEGTDVTGMAAEVIRNLRRHLEKDDVQVIFTNAYADFERIGNNTLSTLYLMGIVSSNVLGSAHKNAADMQMCIDIMSTLYTRHDINRFIVVAGDRDYIPVVQHLKRLGRTVTVTSFEDAISGDLLEILGKEHFVDLLPMLGETSRTHFKTAEVPAPVVVSPTTQPAKRIKVNVLGKVPVTWQTAMNQSDNRDASACMKHILIFINNKVDFKPGVTQILRYLTDMMPVLSNPQRKQLLEELQGMNAISIVQLAGFNDYSYSAVKINTEHPLVMELQAEAK